MQQYHMTNCSCSLILPKVTLQTEGTFVLWSKFTEGINQVDTLMNYFQYNLPKTDTRFIAEANSDYLEFWRLEVTD